MTKTEIDTPKALRLEWNRDWQKYTTRKSSMGAT